MIAELEKVYEILGSVNDPEIPVLSIIDLGILRNAAFTYDDTVEVTITPTYSGCPAMDSIEADIRKALTEAGYKSDVKTSISPAWTTDWMSEAGRKKLEDYGIAPPAEATTDKSFITGVSKRIRCPRCKSENTQMISRFGSTACKSLYKCDDCLETFDYFKCI